MFSQIPKREVTEYDGNILSAPREKNLEVPNQSTPRRSSSPDLNQRTSSTPPDYGKFKAIDSEMIYDKNLLSVSNSAANAKKESSRFSWSGYKRAFKVNDRRNSSSFLDSESNESGED